MSDEILPTDPDVDDPKLIDELTALYHRDGKLTAESLLAYATENQESALHARVFRLDDAQAAYEYRLEQCRLIIRSVHIVVHDQEVRAFPYIPSAGSYAPLRDAFANVDWRKEILAEFKRDAERFEKRWASHKIVADAYRKWKQSAA